MPRNTPRYTKDLHVLIAPEEHEFVSKLNGGIGHHIRQMIRAHMGKYDADLAELETRFAEIEPEYLSLKKRIDEMKKEKKRLQDAQMAADQRVEEAHKKLVELFKSHHSQIELIPKNYFKVYADFCGQPVETLMAWLEEEVKK